MYLRTRQINESATSDSDATPPSVPPSETVTEKTVETIDPEEAERQQQREAAARERLRKETEEAEKCALCCHGYFHLLCFVS